MALASLCSPTTFTGLSLFGADILSVETKQVTNFSTSVQEAYNFNHPAIQVRDASFCNVTVSYTHPGQNDTINVEAWLPANGTWNERLQAQGGGGWIAGRFYLTYQAMAGAIGEGYATVTTDGGIGSAQDPRSWGLISPGNVNLYALQDFSSVALNDESIIAKSLVNSFYGEPPKFSYWNGCSQGGRQGLMLAQRYPNAYDGIAASAPAINWSELVASIFWPQLVMNLMGKYPYGCEIDTITAAAVVACDGNDGIIDSIISDPDLCHFDPFTVVGKVFNCSQTGSEMQISEAAAIVVNATWSGPRTSKGEFIWYGPTYGSDLSGSATGVQATAATQCFANGTCTAAPEYLATLWYQLFVEKNPNYNMKNITHEDFDRLVHASLQQFTSIIGTNDPDLREFRDAGGKMLAFHGLNDQVIPVGSTQHYYNAVTEVTSDVHDFYRFFEVPGLGHCFGGNGGQPTSVFDAMRAWVESGTVPDTLPISFSGKNGTENHRILCPYPQKAQYNGNGDPSVSSSFECV